MGSAVLLLFLAVSPSGERADHSLQGFFERDGGSLSPTELMCPRLCPILLFPVETHFLEPSLHLHTPAVHHPSRSCPSLLAGPLGLGKVPGLGRMWAAELWRYLPEEYDVGCVSGG